MHHIHDWELRSVRMTLGSKIAQSAPITAAKYDGRHPDCDGQKVPLDTHRVRVIKMHFNRARRGREPRDGGSCPNPLACWD